MNREELTAELQKRYPNMFLRTTEEFNGSEGGIWTSGEEGSNGPMWGGLPLFDYYSQDGGSESYTVGINNFFYNWLEENNWYCEWNDPGTVMIWEI